MKFLIKKTHVVQPDPVTSLVREGLAEVVVGGAAARGGGEEHDDAVVGGSAAVAGGKSRIAEQAVSGCSRRKTINTY